MGAKKAAALEWIDVEEAVRITGLRKKAIYRLIKRKNFAPEYRIGKLIKFDRNELYVWMMKKRTTPSFEK